MKLTNFDSKSHATKEKTQQLTWTMQTFAIIMKLSIGYTGTGIIYKVS